MTTTNKHVGLPEILDLLRAVIGFRQIGQTLVWALEPNRIEEFLLSKKEEFNFPAKDLRTLSEILNSMADDIDRQGSKIMKEKEE